MQEMLDGKSAVSEYQKANEVYRNCLSEKIEAVNARPADSGNKGEAASIQAEHEKMVEAYNDAVGAEEALADQFNKAIRAYKKANPG